MRRIALSYAIQAQPPERSAQPVLLRNPMMDVLHAVREQGSISAAARQLNLSYRHVWGQLKDWEADLGQELLLWERGRSAQLSPLGERLLMAERLAQARLGPQMESLRAELERAFALAFTEPGKLTPQTQLTLYASHDHALTALQHFAAGLGQAERSRVSRLHLDLRRLRQR